MLVYKLETLHGKMISKYLFSFKQDFQGLRSHEMVHNKTVKIRMRNILLIFYSKCVHILIIT